MQFIHARQYLHEGDVVVVDCDHQCNVQILTDDQFARYKRGEGFEYVGGFYKCFPVRIVVPNTGYWNTTLDLAGRQANLRYNIGYLT